MEKEDSKYGNVTLAEIEKVIDKLGGLEKFREFLRDDPVVSKPVSIVPTILESVTTEKQWYEKNGMIRFTVISDGTTGEQWIARLESKGFKLSKWAKELLLSEDFKATTGTIYDIAVINGGSFTDKDRVSGTIVREAMGHKFIKLSPEAACLIREKFSDEEMEKMGFNWMVFMHKPIMDSAGDPNLLGTFHSEKNYLGALPAGNGMGWNKGIGFVFEYPRAA